jgi:hypothetical protein
MDDTGNLVQTIYRAVADLAEEQRFMTIDEREMLRAARLNIMRVLDADLLLRVRFLSERPQGRPRIYLDMSDVPKTGIGLSQPDDTRLESPTVHAL